ncbi:unnamed protein product [Orchesella dallaii]|uniref:Uncharacterized protein n=1 Tax=Orchesella dallaii TaxID=48710 RepID=A0ABP1RF22_9HEXA
MKRSEPLSSLSELGDTKRHRGEGDSDHRQGERRSSSFHRDRGDHEDRRREENGSSSSSQRDRHRRDEVKGRSESSTQRDQHKRDEDKGRIDSSSSHRDRHRRDEEKGRSESSTSSSQRDRHRRENDQGHRDTSSSSHRTGRNRDRDASHRDFRHYERDESRSRDSSRHHHHRQEQGPFHMDNQQPSNSRAPFDERGGSSNRGGRRGEGESRPPSSQGRPSYVASNSSDSEFGNAKNGVTSRESCTPQENSSSHQENGHHQNESALPQPQPQQSADPNGPPHHLAGPSRPLSTHGDDDTRSIASNGSSRRGREGAIESRRGRGGGRGRGRGTAARRRSAAEEFDLVVSRPQTEEGRVMSKQAVLGTSRPVHLQTNYFEVACRPNWCIHHYRVDFKPDETDTWIKKRLFRQHMQNLPVCVFDGSSLYVTQRLDPDPMTLVSTRTHENDQSLEQFELNIRLVGDLAPTDGMYLQLFNILVRQCLETMNLEEMGRHFYDRHKAIRIEGLRLELWPGYKTSMRNHENSILLGVELTNKVLRLDNCLQIMNMAGGRDNDQNRVRNAIIGNIVMTNYNRKTYRVDDIAWDLFPTSTFDKQGRATTYLEYFRDRYNVPIQDLHQPLLVSKPKKKDYHRGNMGPIFLVPELCQMTGLTDEMRANTQLMRALSNHMVINPNARVTKLNEFMRKLQTSSNNSTQSQSVSVLEKWGLKFKDRLVELQGHIIPNEKLLFGEGQFEMPNQRYDWSQGFKKKPMYSSVPLNNWVIIVPSSAAWGVDKLINSMQCVARPLKFPIANPLTIHRISSDRPNDYANAVDQVVNQYRDKLQLIFFILPRLSIDSYSAVKKRASVEFGIVSQCLLAPKLQNQQFMSVCTKLVIQINSKLGGEPWGVNIPLRNLMVVGFDVHHCGKRKGSSVGAMVATTSQSQGKFFSTISFHSNKDDVSDKVGADFTKCLYAYSKANNELPGRIIMYRDGVADGQLKYVYETELNNIRASITNVYKSAGKDEPRFTFIVITKKINTRIFSLDRNGEAENPSPGTVVDDVITLPERYDFYLISQHSNRGTVSPVSYNILYDRQGIDADKIQRFTFKLCHMYFNWSGTVTVPAPCQYAKKLAYLTGLALGAPAHERLSHSLHYL